MLNEWAKNVSWDVRDRLSRCRREWLWKRSWSGLEVVGYRQSELWEEGGLLKGKTPLLAGVQALEIRFPEEFSEDSSQIGILLRVTHGVVRFRWEETFGLFCSPSLEPQWRYLAFLNEGSSQKKRVWIENGSEEGVSFFEIHSWKKIKNPFLVKEQKAGFFDLTKASLETAEALQWSLFFAGKDPFLNHSDRIFREMFLQRTSSSFVATLKPGVKFWVDPWDESSKAFWVSGFYEPIELGAFLALAEPAQVILDVGANIGIYSLIAAAAKPGKELEVFAFEPSEREQQRFLKNRALNPELVDKVTLSVAAVGAFQEKRLLKVSENAHAGHNTLGEFVYSSTKLDRIEAVDQITLDDFIKEKDLKRVDLIKVDVEGEEWGVFQGAEKTLRQFHPDLFLELSVTRLVRPWQFLSQMQQLEEIGYRFFIFDPRGLTWKQVFSGDLFETQGALVASFKDPQTLIETLQKGFEFFQKAPLGERESRGEDLRKSDSLSLEGIQVFCSSSAFQINERRLEHLAVLPLSFRGKKVLEVGGGIGLHTPFFLSQGAEVWFTDSRIENLKEARKRLPNFVPCELLDLENPQKCWPEGFQFDVIYCYGTLYHLADPEKALTFLAKETGASQILLETCLSFEDNHQQNQVLEVSEVFNQASSGVGCRPSQSWVLDCLKKLWGHAVEWKVQPSYFDFYQIPKTFSATDNFRSTFLGFRVPESFEQGSVKAIALRDKEFLNLPSFCRLLNLEDLPRLDQECQNRSEEAIKWVLGFRSGCSLEALIQFCKSHSAWKVISYQVDLQGQAIAVLVRSSQAS